ncbi:MAG: NB-ARC domain-containing protein [Cyanobacteria bacterium P01_D01_bin.73]
MALPEHFVPRPEFTDQIRDRLLSDEVSRRGTLAISSIHGLGGVGKSVLAAALTYTDEVRDRFPDGILWATLGQQPDLLPLLGQWIYTLGDRDYSPTTVDAASSYLRSLLADKTMLLVVDDLWDASHFQYFKLAGKGCRVLVTTREVRLPEAAKFELDVMSLDQAIALVEKRLGAIAATDREDFEALVAAVGFLPLAIELAAAQVGDGLSWGEVLADFRGEFDALDRETDEVTSESVKRKLSLRACFQLSLRRLSPDALARFAWLGMTPEDAAVPVAMVTRLWQVSDGEARKILQGFRDRSLILSGANGGFRMHDLLHDLAQQLLVGDSQESLPGLGLTVAIAHGTLLERYLPESGCWADLADDGYIYGRLTWHMERAGQVREIHQLIRQARGDGRNAWYEACEDIGQLPIFVADVARAWRLAEETYGIIPTEPEGWEWQMWCAFVTVSLNSLVGNVPPELIAALVEKGVWSEVRGLAYAMQKRKEKDRDEAIAALVPHLSSHELVNEALDAVWNMVSGGDHILKAVVIYQWELLENSEFLDDPMAIADEIEYGWFRSQALSRWAISLPQERLPESLEIVRDIPDGHWQAQALSYLGYRLPEELLPEALAIARNTDEVWRAEALLSLVDRLPEITPEALQAACNIAHEEYREKALSQLADKLPPDLFPQALQAARDITDDRSRAKALSNLADHLPGELLPEALQAARDIPNDICRLEAISGFAGRLPELQQEVLQLVRQVAGNFHSFLPSQQTWARNLATETLPEALQIAREIPQGDSQASVLVALSNKLPVELLPEALQITQAIEWDFARVKALSALANKLPEELLSEAIEIARDISSNSARVKALASFSDRSPKLLSEALEIVPKILGGPTRTQALSDLIDKLPAELLPKAFQIARNISDEYSQALIFVELTKELPQLLPETLQAISNLSYEGDTVEALSTLTEAWTELPPEVLEIARNIEDESDRVKALSKLADKFPELMAEVLQSIREMSDSSDIVYAIEDVAGKLPTESLPQAVQIARNISNESERAEALTHLSQKLQELLPEIIQVIRDIPDEDSRAGALLDIVPTLPSELLPAVLQIAQGLSNTDWRLRLLVDLAEKFSGELVTDALEAVRNISDDDHRWYPLLRLAKYQPALLSETLQSLRGSCPKDLFRPSVLRSLPNPLATESALEILNIVREISDEFYQAEALWSLVEILPKEALSDALQVARSISCNDSRARSLLSLAYRQSELLPEAIQALGNVSIWMGKFKAENVQCLVEKSPPELLPDVIRITVEISEEQNRADALADLGEMLTGNLQQQVREASLDIEDPCHRAKALAGFLESDASLWQDLADQDFNLLRLLAPGDRQDFLEHIPKLHHHLQRLEGQPAVDATLQAMRDACQQWP